MSISCYPRASSNCWAALHLADWKQTYETTVYTFWFQFVSKSQGSQKQTVLFCLAKHPWKQDHQQKLSDEARCVQKMTSTAQDACYPIIDRYIITHLCHEATLFWVLILREAANLNALSDSRISKLTYVLSRKPFIHNWIFGYPCRYSTQDS